MFGLASEAGGLAPPFATAASPPAVWGLQLALLAASMAIEIGQGYPPALYRTIGHPVTWIGAVIAWCDRTLNSDAAPPALRRALGLATLIAVVALSAGAALALQLALSHWLFGLVVLALAGSFLVAARSLDEHVLRVASALETAGLGAGRNAVSMIVGRDTQTLDEHGVARAAIESLAENFSDGVVAPVVWGAIGGLPGMAGYKAANTLDSMIGHKDARHLHFGWASARFDDLVNLPASRLSALLLCLAAFFVPGASPRGALVAVFRDAPHHRSPNAGWPEAAMAGALGFRLAGPRIYGGQVVVDGYMGNGRPDLTAADIRRALQLFRIASGMLLGLVIALAAAAGIIAALQG